MVDYFPEKNNWERRDPEELGIEKSGITEAIEFAKDNDSKYPYQFTRKNRNKRNANRIVNYSKHDGGHGDEHEYSQTLGPLPDKRGGPSGVVIHDGYIVGEWGEIEQVELANSITKSYLSTVAGIAYDRGLIGDVDDYVTDYIYSGDFDYSHNDRITWHQLLNQTSEWEGKLFNKPDFVDRRKGRERELREPGTFWEYNNVRVNLLSVSLLRLFKKPLPLVLKEAIMDEIAAADTWKWHGYDNSEIVISDLTGGQRVKSISGGGQWGGGLWTNALDLARVGYLLLNNGEWRGSTLISDEWIEMATTQCEVKPTYGYLWWLNTDQKLWPDLPESCFAAIGGGQNVIWVNPEHDAVAVLRWFDDEKASTGENEELPKQNRFFKKVVESL